MPGKRQFRLVGAIGRRIERSVCDGSVANAARSVHDDRERADQRRDAWLAVRAAEREMQQLRTS